MITTPKRRSPKATIPKIAIERATLVLQQLPPKPKPISSTAAKRERASAHAAKPPRSAGKTSIVAALNATAIAEKKAFLNRKIKDVISVLLDESPPKKKTRKTKK
ncbi:hypothetical protein H6G89_17635 [Oscillatoria sp. FACHB-1407]|uniref:hypothetical protein n=1 Tax=Oscillatoria sp. FACHB-1407 TaxID=2692847 RepID=UPI00168650BF|nr:hypothetical protein [Oscillatoria sp. FACHB-1407]MBD2462865.1 hypothetical protein [Oscillatoria sp. FACHB-1407]